ncbi:hypothetical protein FRC02_004350 [Tulasnella sp. 418]|nr:hypothetical protein FRC02_004350 [Tulasnella sp. 418]
MTRRESFAAQEVNWLNPWHMITMFILSRKYPTAKSKLPINRLDLTIVSNSAIKSVLHVCLWSKSWIKAPGSSRDCDIGYTPKNAQFNVVAAFRPLDTVILRGISDVQWNIPLSHNSGHIKLPFTLDPRPECRIMETSMKSSET